MDWAQVLVGTRVDEFNAFSWQKTYSKHDEALRDCLSRPSQLLGVAKPYSRQRHANNGRNGEGYQCHQNQLGQPLCDMRPTGALALYFAFGLAFGVRR